MEFIESPLLNLIKTDAFPIGRHGHSKNITHLPNQSPFHLTRVEGWDPESQDPILDGDDHKNGQTTDFIFRGGFATHADRVKLDVKRIQNFLNSNIGGEFKLRQGALQLLNSQENTRTFNRGLSLITQIGASGLSNFKRAGALPTPASVDFNAHMGSDLGSKIGESGFGKWLEGSKVGQDFGITAEGLGNFVTNAIGGDYISLIGKDNLREQNYGIGDIGAGSPKNVLDHVLGDINPFKKKHDQYNLTDNLSKIDKINYQTVYGVNNGKPEGIPSIPNTTWDTAGYKDFIDFRFEVINSGTHTKTKVILFRAFLDSFGDNYNATHNEVNYNGRGESFYTYNKFNRAMNINFKIAAQTRHEMKPIYQKLNYLVAQTAPNYSSTGRIRTPYMRLTMGDYFSRIPGVLKSVQINWEKNYPWEIKLDPLVKDKDMKVLPQVLNVGINYQPIHDFTPHNGLSVAFIGIGKDKTDSNSWLLQEPTNYMNPAGMEFEQPTKGNNDNKLTTDIEGCMDKTATNYNPDATKDDGSCIPADVNGNTNNSRPLVQGYPDYTSEGTFGKAFNAARNELGAGQIFYWGGNNAGLKTTDRADD